MKKLKDLTPEEKEEFDKLAKEMFSGIQKTVRAVTENIDLPKLSMQIQEIVKPYEPILQKIQEIQKAALPIVNQLNEQFKAIAIPAMPYLKEFTLQAVKLSEGLRVWKEKSDELAKQLEKDDVFLVPFFGQPHNVHTLVVQSHPNATSFS